MSLQDFAGLDARACTNVDLGDDAVDDRRSCADLNRSICEGDIALN